MNTPSLRNLTIAKLMKETAAHYPDRLALFDDTYRLTYTELDNLTDRLATGLLCQGIQTGDLVGLYSGSTLPAITFFYALQKIGARVVLLPEVIHPSAYSRYLNKLPHMKSIICDQSRSTLFDQSGFDRQMQHFILSDTNTSAGHWIGLDQLLSFAPSAREQIYHRIREGHSQSTAVLLFTSGTTGDPKIVCSSNYSRVNGGIQQAFDIRMGPDDIVLGALPMHHCFALSVNIMAALASGAALFIPKDRHTKTLLDALENQRCTIFSSVPTVYRAILRKQTVNTEKLCLRTGIIGGGGYSPENFIEIEKTFGFTLMSSLGLTEATAGVTICHYDDPLEIRSTTLGHFMSHVESKIVDMNTGQECPTGVPGEICVRGYVLMQEYYNDPQATRAVIDENGWLHCGDLGWMDENRNLHLSGRIKEIIIRGGENICPSEVEAALMRVLDIADCKVVGVPSSHYGEELCACIVTQKDIAISTLQQAAKTELPDFKVPRYAICMEALPLNANGKIDINACRRIAREHCKNSFA